MSSVPAGIFVKCFNLGTGSRRAAQVWGLGSTCNPPGPASLRSGIKGVSPHPQPRELSPSTLHFSTGRTEGTEGTEVHPPLV